QLAYMLATAKWETQHFTQLEEQGSDTYLAKYQDKNGNVEPMDYKKYRGRGYVQLRYRDSYKKADEKLGTDLVTSPFLASQPPYAYQIMVRGCLEGWFTGAKLVDYISKDGSNCDYRNARNIINPYELQVANSALTIDPENRSKDQIRSLDIVSKIAEWASCFEALLQSAVVETGQLQEIPDEYIISVSNNTESAIETIKNRPINDLSKVVTDFLPASTGTLRRLLTTLFGSLSAALAGIATFIKSEPVISGIIIIVAILVLAWLISFYIYCESNLDHKRIDVAADPEKNNAK
ncbi:MAG: hypothetical protein AB1489_25810, partial [Acidobacteriota bacterium]